MNISDRRRAALREVGDFLVRARPLLTEYARDLYYGERHKAHETVKALADEAHKLAEQALLACLPDGGVVYLDDEVGLIELERDGITLVIPNETPDDVVDALFAIAKSIRDPTSMRYTARELADRVDSYALNCRSRIQVTDDDIRAAGLGDPDVCEESGSLVAWIDKQPSLRVVRSSTPVSDTMHLGPGIWDFSTGGVLVADLVVRASPMAHAEIINALARHVARPPLDVLAEIAAIEVDVADEP